MPGKPRPSLDDVMREISGRGIFGGRAAPVVWGFGGFLIGAIFWHAIGFWGFIGDVVLKGPDPHASTIARSMPIAEPANCTALALDRATGETYSAPCARSVHPLEEAANGRQDLALAESSPRDGVVAPIADVEPDGPRRVSQQN